MKNMCYEVECDVDACDDKYIGETHRTLRKRITEHCKPGDSHVFKHFSDKHPGVQAQDNIKVKAIAGCFQDTMHRVSTEARLIKKDTPSLNVQRAR